MENKKYLECIYTTQKDFYKKAYTIEEEKAIKLYSYKTLVATVDKNKHTYELNNEIEQNLLLSNTTKRHITEFLLQNGFNNAKNNKKWLIDNQNKGEN